MDRKRQLLLLGALPAAAPVSPDFAINLRGYDQVEGAGGEDSGFTYRFAAKDFGSLAVGSPGDYAILKIYAASASATISAVSVGGVAATAIVRDTAGTTRLLGMYAVPITSGGPKDIVITLSAAGTRCGVEWSTINNTSQTTYGARIQAGGTALASASATYLEDTLTPPADGLIVAAAFHSGTTAGGEFTWTATVGTGATHVNQRVGAGPFFSTFDIKQNGANTIRAAHAMTADVMRFGAFTWGP